MKLLIHSQNFYDITLIYIDKAHLKLAYNAMITLLLL